MRARAHDCDVASAGARTPGRAQKDAQCSVVDQPRPVEIDTDELCGVLGDESSQGGGESGYAREVQVTGDKQRRPWPHATGAQFQIHALNANGSASVDHPSTGGGSISIVALAFGASADTQAPIMPGAPQRCVTRTCTDRARPDGR